MRRIGNAGRLQRLAGGGLLLLFGLGMLAVALTYPLGRVSQMGPGFVPVLMAVAISGLALVTLWTDIAAAHVGEAPAIQWRGLLFISASILAFALLVPMAGLVPAMFVAVALSKLADHSNGPLGIIVYSAASAAAGWLLFLVVLELPIQPFWA